MIAFELQAAEGKTHKPTHGSNGQSHDGIPGTLGVRLLSEFDVQQSSGADDALVARTRGRSLHSPSARHTLGLAPASLPGGRWRG